jgi:hypothetical protein
VSSICCSGNFGFTKATEIAGLRPATLNETATLIVPLLFDSIEMAYFLDR